MARNIRKTYRVEPMELRQGTDFTPQTRKTNYIPCPSWQGRYSQTCTPPRADSGWAGNFCLQKKMARGSSRGTTGQRKCEREGRRVFASGGLFNRFGYTFVTVPLFFLITEEGCFQLRGSGGGSIVFSGGWLARSKRCWFWVPSFWFAVSRPWFRVGRSCRWSVCWLLVQGLWFLVPVSWSWVLVAGSGPGS